jgi:2',3'-cyclic-nucleotide 3'-phosphodiesterase/NEDD4-binding protein 2
MLAPNTLILLRGVSGSGKSTLASWLCAAIDGMIQLEADDWMYQSGEYQFDPKKLGYCHTRCEQEARKFLKLGYTVVVSNTSTTEKEVAVYQQIAEECEAQFISLIVEHRHAGKNIHNVPDEKLQQMKQRFSVKL